EYCACYTCGQQTLDIPLPIFVETNTDVVLSLFKSEVGQRLHNLAFGVEVEGDEHLLVLILDKSQEHCVLQCAPATVRKHLPVVFEPVLAVSRISEQLDVLDVRVTFDQKDPVRFRKEEIPPRLERLTFQTQSQSKRLHPVIAPRANLLRLPSLISFRAPSEENVGCRVPLVQHVWAVSRSKNLYSEFFGKILK